MYTVDIYDKTIVAGGEEWNLIFLQKFVVNSEQFTTKPKHMHHQGWFPIVTLCQGFSISYKFYLQTACATQKSAEAEQEEKISRSKKKKSVITSSLYLDNSQ